MPSYSRSVQEQLQEQSSGGAFLVCAHYAHHRLALRLGQPTLSFLRGWRCVQEVFPERKNSDLPIDFLHRSIQSTFVKYYYIKQIQSASTMKVGKGRYRKRKRYQGELI